MVRVKLSIEDITMRWLAALALTSTLAAMASPSSAQTTQPFQVMIVPGSSTQPSAVFVMDTSTGQTRYSSSDGPFAPIVDPAPIPASTYRLDYFSTFDSQQKATWDAYRSDLKSGRVWHFICCQTTSWSEIVNAK
jgi:hypothetical protein